MTVVPCGREKKHHINSAIIHFQSGKSGRKTQNVLSMELPVLLLGPRGMFSAESFPDIIMVHVSFRIERQE